MKKGIRLIGNGQGEKRWTFVEVREAVFKCNMPAPVHRYWKEILNDYIIPGKFDPTFMISHRVPIEDL